MLSWFLAACSAMVVSSTYFHISLVSISSIIKINNQGPSFVPCCTAAGISPNSDLVAKATRTVIIIRNLRYQQFLYPSIENSRVVAILYSRDSNYKAYDYYIVAGETC